MTRREMRDDPCDDWLSRNPDSVWDALDYFCGERHPRAEDTAPKE